MVKNKNYRHTETINNLSSVAFRSREFQWISCMYKNIQAITERGICLQWFFSGLLLEPRATNKAGQSPVFRVQSAANQPSPYTVPT